MYLSPKEHEKNITAKLLCGSAGLLGQTITYPLDVVKRQMQVQALSVTDKARTLKSLMLIVNRQGCRQLFSGLSINYLKVHCTVIVRRTVKFCSITFHEPTNWTAPDGPFSELNHVSIKVVPSVAIGFTVYDLMKAFLEVPSREEVAAEMKAADSSRQSSLIYSG